MNQSILTLIGTAFTAAAIEILLIWRFATFKKHDTFYFILIFISWFLPLYELMLIPVDISSTSYRQCNNSSTTTSTASTASTTSNECHIPENYISEAVLYKIFKVIYWSMQFCTWIALPMCKGFEYSGKFTILGRIKATLIENIKYYILYLVLFIIILIYMVARPEPEPLTLESIRALMVTTFNTFGIIVLIFIMGYGMVDLPRYLWKISLNKYELNHSLFELSKYSEELHHIDEKIKINIKQLNKALSIIHPDSPLRDNVETIIKKLPREEQDKVDACFGVYVPDTNSYQTYYENPSIWNRIVDVFYIKKLKSNIEQDYREVDNLAELHSIVINNVFARTRCKNLINYYIRKSLLYENIINFPLPNQNTFSIDSNKNHSKYTGKWLPYVETLWYLKLKKYCLRFISLLFFIFSLILLFCEVSFFSTNPTVSVLAIIVYSINKSHISQIFAQFLYFMVLIYMSACTYQTIFQLRLFSYLRVDTNHQTSIFSLLSIGNIFCFLTSPISLNFLCLIHFDKGTLFKTNQLIETSFSTIMGRFDILPFFSKYFNIYFPICIIFVCVFSVFSGINRFLNLFGTQTLYGNNIIAQDMVSDGRSILQREKSRRELEQNVVVPPSNTKRIRSSHISLLNDSIEEDINSF